jgi:hypothetical protein
VGPEANVFDQGVSVAFLIRIAKAWVDQFPEGDTTQHMVDDVVKPLTKGRGYCLLDLVKPHDKGRLTKENGYFISHRWGAGFSLETVELVKAYFNMHSEDAPGAKTTYVWMVSGSALHLDLVHIMI